MTEDSVKGPQAKILLVDDVAVNLRILRDALSPEGYEILIATSGEMALKAVAGTPPDLILLDIMMPGIDGYEVCLRLKQDPSTRHIPVIFISARDEVESLVEGFRAGSVDYITRPFAKEEMLIRTEVHLNNSRLVRALQEKNEALELEMARRQRAEE